MANEETRPLPAPVLTEHEYQYAMVVELRRIAAALDQLIVAASTPGEVVLKETAPPKPKPKRGDP